MSWRIIAWLMSHGRRPFVAACDTTVLLCHRPCDTLLLRAGPCLAQQLLHHGRPGAAPGAPPLADCLPWLT
jgi:hypothetical protein